MLKTCKWISAVIFVAAFGMFPLYGNAEAPTLSLGEDATVRIPVGTSDGVTQMIMRAENLTQEAASESGEPRIRDQGGVGPVLSTEVQFSNPVEINSGAASRTWLWTANVKGLPANSTQNRYALLAFGEFEKSVPYTVTNLSPAAFTWSVAAPAAPWFVWFGISRQLSTPVVVTTGDYPASGIRLAQSSIRNELGTAEISLESLELCDSPTGPGGQFDVYAHATRTFYIRLKEKTGQWIWQDGKYTGTVSFAVNERPDLQTVSLTIQASSPWARLVGAILVAGGIFLGWWVSVWAHARLLRLEALKPVAALLESVNSLLDELKKIRDKIGVDIPGGKDNIQARLNLISESLSIKNLDKKKLLPYVPPSPMPDGQDSSTELQTFLTENGDRVAGLTILIRDGMNKVLQDWPPDSDKKRQAIMTALQKIYEKGYTKKNSTECEQLKTDVLKQYEVDKGVMTITPRKKEFVPPTHVTMQYLSWAISKLYAMGWFIWGVLTLLIGLTVLVFTNPGFGTWPDMVFCLLWGFGLPTGIDKLQQLGPSGIASTIGVSLPKLSS